MRLSSDRPRRAVAAHGEPSPQSTDRGGTSGARTSRNVDVLPSRPRAGRGAAPGVGATCREGGWRQAICMTRARRLTAEAVGTALLLAGVVGSGIMGERLAGGNVAIALLANTLATSAVLVALILTFGRISGVHFNPAVTLTAAWQGGLAWREVPGYVWSWWSSWGGTRGGAGRPIPPRRRSPFDVDRDCPPPPVARR